jgi:GNAT superfamily N-acetyltransferase
MSLREARPGDAQGIARIHLQSWRETYAGIVSPDFLETISIQARLKSWQENLAPSYRGPRFNLVAEVGSTGIVGFASGGRQRDWDRLSGRPHAEARAGGGNRPAALAHLRDYDGELWAIYLLKSHQGSGIGRQLFEAVRLRLKERGFQAMLAWVLKANPACGFYERMGGRELGSKRILIDKEHEECVYGWVGL